MRSPTTLRSTCDRRGAVRSNKDHGDSPAAELEGGGGRHSSKQPPLLYAAILAMVLQPVLCLDLKLGPKVFTELKSGGRG